MNNEKSKSISVIRDNSPQELQVDNVTFYKEAVIDQDTILYKNNQDVFAQALENVFEDAPHLYYFTEIKSASFIIVHDGNHYSLSHAMSGKIVTPEQLMAVISDLKVSFLED